MLPLRRQACYWAISLTSAFVFQGLQQWPFGPIPQMYITCGLNLIFLVACLHRIPVNMSQPGDSLMVFPQQRVRIASVAYHCVLPMVLVSLGYLAKWCDTIYHTSAAMEHTKIQREAFIHALLAYIFVAEVEWIRHGVGTPFPTFPPNTPEIISAFAPSTITNITLNMKFPGNFYVNTVNICGPSEDMLRYMDLSDLSWRRGSTWVAIVIATSLYTFSFIGLTTFINFAWFGKRGQDVLGTPPHCVMNKDILNQPFFFQMVLVAPLRVMNHSVRI